MALTIELVEDYWTVRDLWRFENIVEMGYFIGKAIVNSGVFLFGAWITYKRLQEIRSLETVDDEEDAADAESLYKVMFDL